jgi:hypothetical protein
VGVECDATAGIRWKRGGLALTLNLEKRVLLKKENPVRRQWSVASVLGRPVGRLS